MTANSCKLVSHNQYKSELELSPQQSSEFSDGNLAPTMKDKFKQTSIFSTFKRKLDNIKWRRGTREEPVLLGIKSTRTNCEVSDDFEYIDSRRKDSDIYCSVNSLYCSTQGENLQEPTQVVRKNKLTRKKKKGMLEFSSRLCLLHQVVSVRE